MKSQNGDENMLIRKIESLIREHLQSTSNKVLLIDGARQVGKTYIIRYVGEELYKNFIEINMIEDSLKDRLFERVKTVEDFYFQVSMLAGNKMGQKEDTLIFIDEIQAYPALLTLLKFLSQDGRFTFIASGSLLGVTLSQTTSIPMGSIRKVRMFPLDFEEFLYANGFNEMTISFLRKKYENEEALDEATHNKIMELFRKYLLVGGLPEAVNSYIQNPNIVLVREIQNEIREYYAADASKYDEENKLKSKKEIEKKRSVSETVKFAGLFDTDKSETEYALGNSTILGSIVMRRGKPYLKYNLSDEFRDITGLNKGPLEIEWGQPYEMIGPVKMVPLYDKK